MNWDDSLIQEIAERRAIFVLGAGASMSSATPDGQRPPSWAQLLNTLKEALDEKADRTYANTLINSGRLLEAAEVIQMNIDPAEFSKIIRDKLKIPDFQPSSLHRLIMEIDPKIVITTNYDQIYEKLFHNNPLSSGYSVVHPENQDTIINSLRSGERCVIKMHGCVTAPNNIVLSKTSYFNSRRNFINFYKTIDALFLVNTIIFIGSSLDDPDLQLVLENSQIAAPSIYKHIAILEKRRHEAQRKILRENFNIRPVEYRRGNHGEVVSLLEGMRDQVIEWRENHD